MIELRPYQIEVVDRFNAAINSGNRSVLLEMPTGSGKTVVIGRIVADAVGKGQRVLVLAHRRELIAQASAKLYSAGIDHGIIQAGFPPRQQEKVQIASIQTLHARAVRGRAMELPAADMIVIDEAHHAPARTYQRIVDAYPNAIVFGVTATPCRADGRGLGRHV